MLININVENKNDFVCFKYLIAKVLTWKMYVFFLITNLKILKITI